MTQSGNYFRQSSYETNGPGASVFGIWHHHFVLLAELFFVVKGRVCVKMQ